MKHALIFFLFLLLIVINSCSENTNDAPRYYDISEFSIDTTIISDGAAIEVIGYSGAPKKYNNTCYTHAVVINMESGDTVNLLLLQHIEITAKNRMQNYISPNSNIWKIMNGIDLDVNDMHTSAANWYSQVYSNSKYVGDEWRRFPSIIGIVGKVERNNDLSDKDEIIEKIMEEMSNAH